MSSPTRDRGGDLLPPLPAPSQGKHTAPPNINGIPNPLRMLRERRGLTLAQAAWLAGVSLNTYAGWERRSLLPPILRAYALRNLLYSQTGAELESRLAGCDVVERTRRRNARDVARGAVRPVVELHVSLEIPSGASKERVRQYVEDAIHTHAGGLDPLEDPMFDLNRLAVRVSYNPFAPPRNRAKVNRSPGRPPRLKRTLSPTQRMNLFAKAAGKLRPGGGSDEDESS